MSSDDRTPQAVTYQQAMSEFPDLPEAWRSAVYREAAKIGLTESDPLWWFLVAHAVLLKAFLDGLPFDGAKSGGQNGSEAIKMATPQFVALKNLIEAQAAEVKSLSIQVKEMEKGRGGEHRADPDLEAFLQDWRIQKAERQKNRTWYKIQKWGLVVAIVAGLIAAACLITYLTLWRACQLGANMRVSAMIAAQPYDQRLTAFLAAHHASAYKGPLAQNQDHPETQGIIIQPGDLDLSTPWVSTDGATVIPIRH